MTERWQGHIPVLYEPCMRLLCPERGGWFADGTLGGGGHASGILAAGADGLIAIDKDTQAIARCQERLAEYKQRVRFVHGDFKEIKRILSEQGIERIDGGILDLGVSSFQLDEQDRGFSYAKDAPLDMRMNPLAPLSAEQVVNEYDEMQLKKLIFEYGEERFAARIAAKIVAARPVRSTMQLAEIIKEAIPAAARRTGGNPAKRTFQAIRIEVNGELLGLEEAIADWIDVLRPGGRLAVITFHSLEDRAVKRAMKTAEHPCTCPPDFPQCICGKKPKGRMITRKPLVPDEKERNENPRAHSAKLRVFEAKNEGKEQ